jgi:hypothetical protein
VNESEIKNEIQRTLRDIPYSIWTIGVTDDPDCRGAEHQSPRFWHQWRADSEASARAVEKFFLNKGMRGTASVGEHPTYVYIF